MHQSLKEYVLSKVSMSDSDFEVVLGKFLPKKLRRRQYFLQEGDICKYAAFVIKGALRQYLVDDNGNEHIIQFAIENWWVSDRESLANGTPSTYNIDALEDCELLLVTSEDVKRLEKEVPAFQELMQTIKESNAFAGQKRVVSALSYSAEDRYQDFIRTYPDIVPRVPLRMIASYLGITPETLSRLRRKSANR